VTSLEARIRTRASEVGVRVSTAEVRCLATYVELLDRWNQRMNLTALPLEGLPDDTIDRLLFEPLAAAQALGEGTVDWIDLGSGGGSPALPMKIRRPEARLRMVESRARKAAFLREAVRTLGLASAVVLQARIEDLGSAETASADVVTARGVKLDAELLQCVGHLLRPCGKLLLFASQGTEPQKLAGFRQPDPIGLSRARLLVYAKSSAGSG
jgi:16S rRNA (guanine527-N7)-methyltransferase